MKPTDCKPSGFDEHVSKIKNPLLSLASGSITAVHEVRFESWLKLVLAASFPFTRATDKLPAFEQDWADPTVETAQFNFF